MTAIRCEIIIGANKVSAQAASVHHVSQNIAGNANLSHELLQAMAKFTADTDAIFARYVVWSAGTPPGVLPPGVTASDDVPER